MTPSDIVNTVFSLKALVVTMAVFGFFPGVFLRMIVLAFRRGDPRRAELLGELRAVPFLERPWWVAQQLEVALFEGLWERAFSWAAGRLFWRWHLDSGVESNRQWPESFWIPDDEEKAFVAPGCHVKLMFRSTDDWRERMWVEVTKVGRRRIVGRLSNTPIGVIGVEWDQKIRFRREHIIDIDWDTDVESEPACCHEEAPLDEPGSAGE